MPRAKKRKSQAQNQVQFSRSYKKSGKWRGKANPKPVKSGHKPKKINDKMQNRMVYRSKHLEI